MDIEQFFTEYLSLPAAAFTTCQSALPDEVREAANRGSWIFPVTQLAKLTNPDLLIGEATSEISRLEELAVEHMPCKWRVVAGQRSSLCVLQLVGQQAWDSVAALGQYDQSDCLTLQARHGDAVWAFFSWPKGLVLRASAKKLAPGVKILADGDSCVLVPYSNPWAEVEAIPYWLRDLAFETSENPPGKTLSVPVLSPRREPCRPRVQFEKPRRGERKGYPVCGQAGWRGGFRISSRR